MSSEPVTFFESNRISQWLESPVSHAYILSFFPRKIIPTRSLIITYLIGGHTGIMAADVHLC